MRISAVAVFVSFLAPAWSQAITTIAGTDWLFPGDNTPAVNAPLGGSLGLDVTVGPDGSFYVADADNDMVMKVATDGTLLVVAGNGIEGHTGDGGLAVNAALFGPWGVAVDSQGNVYIAEYGGLNEGGSIRMVSAATGIISTIAGTGAPGFSGDNGPAVFAGFSHPIAVAVDPSGNVYFIDSGNQRIRWFRPGGLIHTLAGGGQISGTSANGLLATSASLGGMWRLRADFAGNIDFIEHDTDLIRQISPGGILSTIAGGGASIADGIPALQTAFVPSGLDVDAKGNLYIADYLTSSIREVAGGQMKTIAGGARGFGGDGGPASMAAFNFPSGAVAVSPSGDVYVADTENLRIRKVSGGVVQTVAGNGQFRLAGNNGPAASATMYYPSGVRTANGNTYITEPTLNRIRRIAADGTISIFAGDGIYGYSGDGGPALGARLAYPTFLTLDSAGDVYFSDSLNNAIRKIDTSGVITSVAGISSLGVGFQGYSGDRGAAAQALLREPAGLDFDGEGNLWFADSGNHAIRVIDPHGFIYTMAGTGVAGYSGDGGPAAAAQLNSPQGLRVFGPGTVEESIYFSDTGNNCVRRIRNVGGKWVIDTVAGNGRAGYSGDMGPAASASLDDPLGLEFDASGNIYVADHLNSVVRAFRPGGMIFTVAGNGTYGFSGDGGAASLAELEEPYDVTFDANGNFLITDFYDHRLREVLNTAPGMQASPAALEFTASAGAAAVEGSISVSGTIPTFALAAAPAAGTGSWLTVTPSAANAPAAIQVTANPAGLAPGQYTGAVQIAAPYENPPQISIPVTFTVTPPGAPSVAIAPAALRFQYVAGSAASTQTLSISNSGGGTLPLTVSAAANLGSWLTASSASVSLAAYGNSPIQIKADPAGLKPGTYSGVIAIASADPPQSVQVPVTMIVTAAPQTIVIPQSGLTFFAVQGGGLPPPQSFNILNGGQGQMGWSVSATTQSGGDWLGVNPADGTSSASSTSAPPQIRVNVYPGTLPPSIYYGSIIVTAPGATNSPQIVSVVMNLLAPGSQVGPLIQPAGMILTAQAGGESGGSQTVVVQSLNTSPVTFTTGISTSAGGNWLTVLPPGGTVTASSPAGIVVQPNVGGLSPGTYRATVTLSFSDGSRRTVNVVYIVTLAPPPAPPASSGTANFSGLDQPAQAVCPTQLDVVFTQLSTGSTVSVGFPGQVAVQVVDDCGTPLTSGNVAVNFSNGDPPLPLISLNNGLWAATWTPQFSAAKAVVTANAADAAHKINGTAQVSVGFQTFTQPPVVGSGGIVNAASLAAQAPLAPGTMISVFGANLADQAGTSTFPLPANLGGSSLIIAGTLAPLSFSSNGQLNAIIPYGLKVNAGQQIIIARGSTLSVAQAVTLAPSSPGIFTIDGTGTGQAKAYVVQPDQSQVLADGNHPAIAGDQIVIYCTGLGEVTPALAAGAAAPAGQVESTVDPVSLTIGGVPATVEFAGLTPGFAGLYQINATVPQGVTPGSAVSLLIAQDGQVSPPVSLAIAASQ